jgi:hypothetical protein
MPETITYRFFAGGDDKIVVDLTFANDTYRLIPPADAPRPDWTRLEVCRCPNCPLPETATHCPAAQAIALFLPLFDTRISYQSAVVEVETPARVIVSKTSFQRGIASLVGLAMATSGCPRTRFLRAMARFHLPFANEQETVVRALGTHLLRQYVAAQPEEGGPVTVTLSQLVADYGELSLVNGAMAERLRSVVSRDATLNAVVILDCFAQTAPYNIDCGFEDVLECFQLEDE